MGKYEKYLNEKYLNEKKSNLIDSSKIKVIFDENKGTYDVIVYDKSFVKVKFK